MDVKRNNLPTYATGGMLGAGQFVAVLNLETQTMPFHIVLHLKHMYVAFLPPLYTVKSAQLEPTVIKPRFSTVLLCRFYYYNDLHLFCTKTDVTLTAI